MTISVFDLFSVGIGPSSSHTVGPMRAARMFTARLRDDGLLGQVDKVKAELFGSLGATGHGHGSPKAVLLGLEGHDPETVDPAAVEQRVETIRADGRLLLAGERDIRFSVDRDLVMHRRRSLPLHPNGMRFAAFGAGGELRSAVYYSVGGGFVVGHHLVSLTPRTESVEHVVGGGGTGQPGRGPHGESRTGTTHEVRAYRYPVPVDGGRSEQ